MKLHDFREEECDALLLRHTLLLLYLLLHLPNVVHRQLGCFELLVEREVQKLLEPVLPGLLILHAH